MPYWTELSRRILYLLHVFRIASAVYFSTVTLCYFSHVRHILPTSSSLQSVSWGASNDNRRVHFVGNHGVKKNVVCDRKSWCPTVGGVCALLFVRSLTYEYI